MAEDLVILGAGGFAREASLLIEEINHYRLDGNRWNLLGYIDEDEARWGLKLRDYAVLGGWTALAALPSTVQVICAVADPRAKHKMVKTAIEQGRSFATLVHPDINLAKEVAVGAGVLINKGSLLTVDIKIGDHVSINPGCGIGHDAMVGDFTTLMWRVNISGSVKIGTGCLVGTGATILQDKTVGEWSTVGAGAVVTKDVPSNSTVAGIPATEI